MNLDLFETECRVPLLGVWDIGMTGCIVTNDSSGILSAFKTPHDEQGGVDLIAAKEILKPCEFVMIERQPPPFQSKRFKSSNIENSVFAQYKETYGLLVGMEKDFYAIRPHAWQKYLGFPSRIEIGDDVWKDFLHAQSLQRFPGRKIPKYQADAFLMMDCLRRIWPLPRTEWP